MICLPCRALADRGAPGETHRAVCRVGCPCRHRDPAILATVRTHEEWRNTEVKCQPWRADRTVCGCPACRLNAQLRPVGCLCDRGRSMSPQSAPGCPTCGPVMHPAEWECGCEEYDCPICTVVKAATG